MVDRLHIGTLFIIGVSIYVFVLKFKNEGELFLQSSIREDVAS